MKLASLLSVQEALGVEAGQDSDNAILAALDAATDDTASRLRTHPGAGDGTRRFRRGDEPVSRRPSRAARPLAWLPRRDTHGEGRAPADGVRRERNRPHGQGDRRSREGRRAIADDEELRGFRPWWFRVSYTAGFTATDGQHFDAVPGWLALAARLHARVALSAHPMFVQNQSTTDARLLQGQLVRILERHARYMPWAETPRAGVVVS